ncbi:dihydroorotase [Cocleimonas sp. KMM 6892]|uniref:dihydroorotase n=1 Tax=unclassified Cocleimonas TaxID=2639732 RepID=UPI002DB6B451|nr:MULTISPECIES: dihydroorotase [unclassified Cocleimonas]MEB8432832.1 dihydroorotase [Cocleimonas sp. KMM 6892]MEC4715691.1 dihydroorotase [Cocleimonas sp. KMM 6895]MEC4744691.1 dihydroorotase [Cocleimonas sp. KMM 6896]
MSKFTLIKNGRIIDPANDIDEIADIAISRGKISGIGTDIDPDFDADHVIDAEGQWILPGIVDLSAYLREPGQENKTRIAFETYSAVSAGITRICCMPETNSPIDSGATVKLIKSKAKQAGFARVSVIGSLTQGLKGEQLSHMGSLKYVGCVGLSQGHQPIQNLATLRKAMEYAATYELPLFLHPIEHSLMMNGGMHEGALSTRLGIHPIPVATETVGMAQILILIKQTNCPVHFCRLSSADSIEMLTKAKQDGLPVTADVAAHQLFLTEMDVADYNPLCHTIPPLRSERDRDALRGAISAGVIDAICSDHQPHEIDAKLAPFEETDPGISAFETLLPLVMRLVEEKVLTLSQAISYITHNPAELAGIKAGTLSAGQPADLSIFDPEYFWQLDPTDMISEGKNSPFTGWGFNGKTTQTFVKGKTVFSL